MADPEVHDDVGDDPPGPGYVSVATVENLEAEVHVRIQMLKDEIGTRWMTLALRLQVEKLEVMVGDKGTMSWTTEGG
jgi:hypothetical protein